MQRKKTISRNRRSPWGVLGILLFIILSAGPFPVLLTTLDPIGALKWRGAEGCLPDTPCGIARPLLLRGGADGGGLYWHQESLERGTRVLALSESGQVVGVGTGWGGHLVHLEGMGSQNVKLAVESPTGYSAVWEGRGDWGALIFRPSEEPPSEWMTSGDATGIPRGYPVGGEITKGRIPLGGWEGGVLFVWER